MKELKNTINKDLTIQFRGTKYTLPSGGKLEVPDDVAVFWKKTHGFLDVLDISERVVLAEEIPKVKTPEKETVEPKKIKVSIKKK